MHIFLVGVVSAGEAATGVDDHARAARDQARGRGALQKLGHHHRYAVCAHERITLLTDLTMNI